jgi:hypothetical protein
MQALKNRSDFAVHQTCKSPQTTAPGSEELAGAAIICACSQKLILAPNCSCRGPIDE